MQGQESAEVALQWLYRTVLQNRKALWKPSLRSDPSLPKVVTYSGESEMFLLFLMNGCLFLQTNVRLSMFPLMNVLRN